MLRGGGEDALTSPPFTKKSVHEEEGRLGEGSLSPPVSRANSGRSRGLSVFLNRELQAVIGSVRGENQSVPFSQEQARVGKSCGFRLISTCLRNVQKTEKEIT